MRKSLLTTATALYTALCASASLNADFEWYHTLTAGNETADATTCFESAVKAPQGDTYILGQFNHPTNSVSTWAKYDDSSIIPDGMHFAEYQKDIMIGRINASGNLKWEVVPTVANISSNGLKLAACPDGGVVLMANATFNSSTGAGAPLLISITDTAGKTTEINYNDAPEGKAPYVGVLIKFNEDGAVEWNTTITSNSMIDDIFTASPMTLTSVATDNEGNIYVGGTHISTVDFGNNVTLPRATNAVIANGKVSTNCDAFLAKFDSTGKAVGVLANDSATPYAATEGSVVVDVVDNTAYVGVLVTCLADTPYSIFGLSAISNPQVVASNLAFCKVDCETMQPVAAGALESTINTTVTAHNAQLKSAQVIGSTLYLSGALQGGYAQDGVELGFSTAKQLQNCVAAINTADMKATKCYNSGSGLGVDSYVFVDETAGKLHSFGYIMTGSQVNILTYNLTTAELEETTTLMAGGTTFAALYNEETQTFIGSTYAKQLKNYNGEGTASETCSQLTGFLFSYSFPELNATSGVINVTEQAADLNATTEYFNLQGMRIANPARGTIVIRRTGSEVTKMIME